MSELRDIDGTVRYSYPGIDMVRLALERARADDLRLDRLDLHGEHLLGINLSYADLSKANLAGAELRHAAFISASLKAADLSGADLRYAVMTRADLTDANLAGAYLNWESHDLLAEVLRRAAGRSIEKRMVAGLLLVSRDRCWPYFRRLRHPLKPWAMGVLAGYVTAQTPFSLRKYLQRFQAKKAAGT